jgi:hypothetical protein
LESGNLVNLLKIRIIGGLLRSKWFPFVPQLIMLAAFILLIFGGFGVNANNPDFIG